METNKTKTKSDLLKELESIKGLLLDDHDIPVLQEIIEQETITTINHTAAPEKTTFSPAELATLKQTYEALLTDAEQLSDLNSEKGEARRPLTSTNGQPANPSKTGQEQTAEASQAAATPDVYTAPQARGENPFLPQHIRARLRGSRMDFSLPEVTSEQSLKTQIINQIIRDLLPELEKQLRTRLLNLTDDALQKLVQKSTDKMP